MALVLQDTLSGGRQEFRPLEPKRVRMYTCGPTVWSHPHVGNYRAFLFYDLVRRHLELHGYEVEHVLNVTDVDDRIIEQAARAGVSIQNYTRPYEEAFFQELSRLRARRPHHTPRATEHVGDMVRLIARLLESGHAYEAPDGVYFRVDSFPAYGALSHLDRAGLRAGARVATDKYEKQSASDFALWKRAQPEDERVGAAWDAPFGRGRPGWHIECSAMAMRYLGPTLDLHLGGIDLLFPHHENEIAQSEAATGRTFVRYWLHSEHLLDPLGEEMHKSVGNVVTMRELLSRHQPAAVRLYLLGSAHYRSKLRLSEEGLHGAAEQVRRLRDLAERLRQVRGLRSDDAALMEDALDTRDAYLAALDDDLNLPAGLGHVFELVRQANAALDRGQVGPAAREALLSLLETVDRHLDVLGEEKAELPEELLAMIAERDRARQRRDFATADRLRAQLRERGVVVEDTPDGVRWRVVGV
jgi:cysteinyl-tRNA synthetase